MTPRRRSDLNALLSERNSDGSYRISQEVSDMVLVRLLLETAASGAQLPLELVEKVGQVCVALGVEGGDPRGALEAAIGQKAPPALLRALRDAMRLDAGDEVRQTSIARLLGADNPKYRAPEPAPKGAVKADALSRFRLKPP